MNAPAKSAAKRRLLLASDRSDESTELASILKAVGDVSTVTTQDIPEQPSRDPSRIPKVGKPVAPIKRFRRPIEKRVPPPPSVPQKPPEEYVHPTL